MKRLLLAGVILLAACGTQNPPTPTPTPTPTPAAFDLQACLTQEKAICQRVGDDGSPAYLGCWAVNSHSCCAQAGLPDNCGN